MWMILWSVSALLHDHGRSSGAAAAAPAPAIVLSSPLTLAVERPHDLPPLLAKRTLEEAAAIWRPLGVTITWMFADEESCTPRDALRLVFTETKGEVENDMALGWIRFLAPEAPEPIVHLSRDHARRLLSTRSGSSVWRFRCGRPLAQERGQRAACPSSRR